MPYRLVFKDISGYYDSCFYCGQSKCGGCTVPYIDAMTIDELMSKTPAKTNDTYFSDDIRTKGKEFQVQVVWHQDIHKSLFNFLTTAVSFPENTESD